MDTQYRHDRPERSRLSTPKRKPWQGWWPRRPDLGQRNSGRHRAAARCNGGEPLPPTRSPQPPPASPPAHQHLTMEPPLPVAPVPESVGEEGSSPEKAEDNHTPEQVPPVPRADRPTTGCSHAAASHLHAGPRRTSAATPRRPPPPGTKSARIWPGARQPATARSGPAATATPQAPTKTSPSRHQGPPTPSRRITAAPLAPAIGQRPRTRSRPAPAMDHGLRGEEGPAAAPVGQALPGGPAGRRRGKRAEDGEEGTVI